ncbi:YbfB/YjiJ family MFS transporter [Tardiphaga sp. 709]|uniref:YbfB/YjiJ family MFS transporter n=1 Tax=Tardiphaga sp. 709 TaxID=3076039 RepID=UPI0028ECFD1C|nr:YbfB/YjiJ family MFS transporter [Tardiphaga sp. 709]WNV11770.1 YbfB/YjiJ family MFS transporter [Tardiphaga sp. 709]
MATTSFSQSKAHEAILPKAWVVALVGGASLSIAMGIGRFAFTPLLPMMLHEGVVDLQSGSHLATANYVGYLLGAMVAATQPSIIRWLSWQRSPPSAGIVRWGLLLTTLLTGLMAFPVPSLWLSLRLLAGAGSAYVLVFTSGWCLTHLARHDRPTLGGLIFMGPGIGIVISGLAASALARNHFTSGSGWLFFAGLSAVVTAGVWTTFQGTDPHFETVEPIVSTKPSVNSIEIGLFVLAYGLAGFGYIITATFLPVIARSTLSSSPWIDLFWPLVGFGAAIGSALSILTPRTLNRRLALAGLYAIQSLGVALTLFFPSLEGFIAGSILVGIPFMVITFYAMQEAKHLRPHHSAALMGALTAAFGMGQILGPAAVAAFAASEFSHAHAFAFSLGTAAASLAIGALLFLTMNICWPHRKGN